MMVPYRARGEPFPGAGVEPATGVSQVYLRPRPELVERYLALLGEVAEPPSPHALRRLHAAHAARFPHDTVWVARGRIPAPDPEAMVEALLSGEGGGCAQLNGGFAWLLHQLGYRPSAHRAAIQHIWQQALPTSYREHLTVTVHFGPEWDGQVEYVDVGLGNSLSESIPREAGRYVQGPFGFELEAPAEPDADWIFRPDRRLRSLRAVSSEGAAADIEHLLGEDIGEVFRPDSPLVGNLWVQHRLPEAIEVLSARTFVRFDATGRTMQVVEHPDEWVALVRETFRLPLPGLTAEEVARVWALATR